MTDASNNPRNPYDSLTATERKQRVLRLLAGVYLRVARQEQTPNAPAASNGQLAFDWQQGENVAASKSTSSSPRL